MTPDNSTDLIAIPYDKKYDPEAKKETWQLFVEVLETKGKIKKVIILSVVIIALAAVSLFMVYMYENYQESLFFESLKPDWHTLIQYKGNAGRFPKDLQEYADYYKNGDNAGTLPVIYIRPQDEEKDEVMLWWKKRTLKGTRIGITESGKPIKEK